MSRMSKEKIKIGDEVLHNTERYVVVSDWRKYKSFFVDQMLGKRWKVIDDIKDKKFVAEYYFKDLHDPFIHEATVVEESSYLNGEVYVVGEGGCHEQ